MSDARNLRWSWNCLLHTCSYYLFQCQETDRPASLQTKKLPHIQELNSPLGAAVTFMGSWFHMDLSFDADSSVGEEFTWYAGDHFLMSGSGRSAGEGIGYLLQYSWASLVFSAAKESAWNVGNLGSIPGLGRSFGEEKGYPLQCSGLENSMNCYSPRGCKESATTERLSLLSYHMFYDLEWGHITLYKLTQVSSPSVKQGSIWGTHSLGSIWGTHSLGSHLRHPLLIRTLSQWAADAIRHITQLWAEPSPLPFMDAHLRKPPKPLSLSLFTHTVGIPIPISQSE